MPFPPIWIHECALQQVRNARVFHVNAAVRPQAASARLTPLISSSTSASEITCAYLACMSKRLEQCENHDRSKQQSSTTKVESPLERLSTVVARTQPDVETPQM